MKMNRYTLCMAAAALFAVLALTGCSLLKVAVATGDPLSKEEMNIRTMTRGFYYDMASEVSRTADSIAAAAPDIATRVAAVRWKIRATRAGVSAAMQGIPDVALADMWILCRRMDEGFAAAPDSLLFGAQSDLARDAAARLDRRAARLARQVLAVDRYGLMERFVADYVRENPADGEMEGSNTTLAWIEFLRANGIEHAYATGSIAEVLADVNDRVSGQTQQLANSVGWSKDLIAMQLQQDSMRLEVGARLDSLERNFTRIVVVAEHLPEISDKVLEELNKQVTQLIYTMNYSLDNAFANFDRQRDELQRYVTAERQALVDQLRESADGVVQRTLDAVPGLVGKVLLYVVLALVVLIGGPFALGFWLGGVRERVAGRGKRARDGILQAGLASALGLHYLCGKIRIMARKKANYPLVEGLEITTLAAEGKAMGRWNDVVVFVPLTVPGDVVDVQIRSKRRRFMEGFVVRYVKKSPLRAEAFCEHFGVCGGCKWQNLPYEEQLRFKTGQVRDQLARIGKIALPEIAPCLGSARTQFYRNKLEFTFADRRWLTREEVEGGADIGAAPALGFHIPGMFDKVLDIRKCWLQPDPSNDIRMETKRFCVENGYTFHNAREHTGLMRNMIVRTASTGEVMVTVVFGADDRERIAALLDHLAAVFPQITSLCYIVNTKLNDSVGDLDPVCYKGKDHIVEEMEGLRFKVGPKSFYQTNSEQAYELYKVAREFADLKPEDVLYDLYTGTGTIANFCAAHCRRVVGIEYVPEAIADAKINSEINGIGNTAFYAGDMKQVLCDEFVAANGRPDVVILDPPRAGVDEPVIGVILRAAPERIVYVSCNPATQARDLALLDADYRVEAVQPVDMFPHTHHVENVVKLVRR